MSCAGTLLLQWRTTIRKGIGVAAKKTSQKAATRILHDKNNLITLQKREKKTGLILDRCSPIIEDGRGAIKSQAASSIEPRVLGRGAESASTPASIPKNGWHKKRHTFKCRTQRGESLYSPLLCAGMGLSAFKQ